MLSMLSSLSAPGGKEGGASVVTGDDCAEGAEDVVDGVALAYNWTA